MKRLALLLLLLSFPAAAQTVTDPATVALVCANNTVVPTPSNGKFFYVQCDATGKLITTTAATTPGGASGTVQYNNAGAFGGISGYTTNGTTTLTGGASTSLAIGGATIGTDALAWTGTATGSNTLTIGGVVNNGNGAASVAAELFNGTLFTGGSGTTTFPKIFIQPTGTSAVSTWSTSGTIIGANVVSGFAGNFLDFHVAGGASVFSVISNGSISGLNVTVSGNVVASSTNSVFRLGADTYLSRPAAASWQLGPLDAASPVAQTLRVQSVVAGTSNANGANLTHIGSLSTGSGTSGDYIIQTGVAPGSGSPTVQATATTALTIKGETQTVQIASGKALQLGNAYVNTSAVATGYLLLTDSAGAVYKIPACLASGC